MPPTTTRLPDAAGGANPTTLTTVFVIDPDPAVRADIRATCRARPGVEVVGETGDGVVGAELVASLRPDVVIVDPQALMFPDVDVVALVRSALPGVVIEMYSHAMPDAQQLGVVDAHHPKSGGIVPVLFDVESRVRRGESGGGPAVPAGAEPATPSLQGIVPDKLEQIMELARTHLQMDVAYVGAFRDGHEVVCMATSGDPASFGIHVGDATPIEDTYCKRMVDEKIPQVIPDSAADPRVRDLPATVEGGIGSYLGVPVRLADGSLYGTFCCVGHDANPTLGSRDAGFMALLAGLVAEHVQAELDATADHRRFRGLLAGGDLQIALQPIVSLTDWSCRGVEALCRFGPGWEGSTAEVYARAADVSMGLELEAMAARAAAQLLHGVPAGQYLAVNMSAAMVRRFVDTVGDGLPLDRIVVEVTEHSAIDDPLRLHEELAPLRAAGLRVAVDDAGSGFASLRRIVALDPDIIKVDRDLVHGMAASPAQTSAVTALVALAADMDAELIAEGVEATEDLSAAADLGIHSAQGYLLAAPSTDPADHALWAQGNYSSTPRPPAQDRPIRDIT